MNLLKLLLVSVAVTATAGGGIAFADIEALPNSGTYFVTSMKSDEALQPMAGSIGQSVKLYPFDKNGLQKWIFTRKLDPKTKKPTDKYTIKNISDDSLNLQLPPMPERAATVGGPVYIYTLSVNSDGISIKEKNGDALYPQTDPPYNSFARFGPDDSSPKFRWKLTKVD